MLNTWVNGVILNEYTRNEKHKRINKWLGFTFIAWQILLEKILNT